MEGITITSSDILDHYNKTLVKAKREINDAKTNEDKVTILRKYAGLTGDLDTKIKQEIEQKIKDGKVTYNSIQYIDMTDEADVNARITDILTMKYLKVLGHKIVPLIDILIISDQVHIVYKEIDILFFYYRDFSIKFLIDNQLKTVYAVQEKISKGKLDDILKNVEASLALKIKYGLLTDKKRSYVCSKEGEIFLSTSGGELTNQTVIDSISDLQSLFSLYPTIVEGEKELDENYTLQAEQNFKKKYEKQPIEIDENSPPGLVDIFNEIKAAEKKETIKQRNTCFVVVGLSFIGFFICLTLINYKNFTQNLPKNIGLVAGVGLAILICGIVSVFTVKINRKLNAITAEQQDIGKISEKST